MKVFHCDSCGNLLFFENTSCVSCHRTVAYLPDAGVVASLERAGDGLWTPTGTGAEGTRYRLCRNYADTQVCNWAIDVADEAPYCASCRLTEVIPDTTAPGTREAWYRLEVAKRRLVYSLQSLALPLKSRAEDPSGGVAFQFMADPEAGETGARVMTGHDNGIITINIAEADDAERERRRTTMHEPYRTVLGHMRHEIGHFYWDRLVRDTNKLEGFRRLFGDEQRDYSEALKEHYAVGAPADWSSRFISAYASSNPWEDWAETWAHYLHMFDTLETAAACGVSLRPKRRDEPSLVKAPDVGGSRTMPFARLIDGWFPLTYMLNNLNRGLGLKDAYPFVLADPIVEKLEFVHDVIDRVVPAAPLRPGPVEAQAHIL